MSVADPDVAGLQGLEALVEAIEDVVGPGLMDEPLSVVFRALHRVLPFGRCLALVERGRRLECIGATTPEEVGRKFDIQGPELKALAGEAVHLHPTAGRNARSARLYLPFCVAGERGLLMAVREAQAPCCSEEVLARALRFAHLAEQAVSLRMRLEAEGRRRYGSEVSEKLARQAQRDHLTGLPNRLKLDQILAEMIARGSASPFTLALLDVNKFKQINDYFGIDVGDNLLLAIAQRIAGLIRPGDVLARINGDEFVIIFDAVSDLTTADMLLDRIVDGVNGCFRLKDYTVYTSVSVGAVRFPEHSTDPAALRCHADSAMYRAKSIPGGSVVHFNSSMAGEVSAKVELEARLRRAIEVGSFTPVFQPQIAVFSRHVTGFEVLLRWQDEDGLLQPPEAFLNAAEELGLLNRIIEITMLKIAQALPLLSERFGTEVTASLNIAAGQATNVEFLERLIRILQPDRFLGRVIFEITEDQQLDIPRFNRSVRPLLDRHGIRIAIDDFGMGYSSLAALLELDAHEVKVDRTFISGIQNDRTKQRFLRMIDYYAQASGMTCVVEGVETAEELRYLSENVQSVIVQGFWFARPMEIDEALKWTPGFHLLCDAS